MRTVLRRERDRDWLSLWSLKAGAVGSQWAEKRVSWEAGWAETVRGLASQGQAFAFYLSHEADRSGHTGYLCNDKLDWREEE